MGLFILVVFLVLLMIWIGSGYACWRLARHFPVATLCFFLAAWVLIAGFSLFVRVYLVNSYEYLVLGLLMIAGLAPWLGTGLGLLFAFMDGRCGGRTLIWFYLPIALPFAGVGGWPLRLAFLESRPALDGLADRVGRGEPVAFPARAGVFEIVSARHDPGTGQILLLIEDRASTSRSGFSRTPNPGLPDNDRLEGTGLPWKKVTLRSPWIYKYEDTFLND